MNTENKSITPSEKACPPGQSTSVSDRSGQPVVERGQELNTEHAHIRTLLDRQTEQILVPDRLGGETQDRTNWKSDYVKNGRSSSED